MNRTLFSLAIIRTNWEINRKDYIENFVPLFATLIKQKAYPEISVDNLDLIKKDFKDEYGLIIPSNPILSILNRLSKKQYIIRESNKFIPNKEKLQDIDITKKSNQIKREFEHSGHNSKHVGGRGINAHSAPPPAEVLCGCTLLCGASCGTPRGRRQARYCVYGI